MIADLTGTEYDCKLDVQQTTDLMDMFNHPGWQVFKRLAITQKHIVAESALVPIMEENQRQQLIGVHEKLLKDENFQEFIESCLTAYVPE